MAVTADAPVADAVMAPADPMAGDTTTGNDDAVPTSKRDAEAIDTAAWPSEPPSKKSKADAAPTPTAAADPEAPHDGTPPTTSQPAEAVIEQENKGGEMKETVTDQATKGAEVKETATEQATKGDEVKETATDQATKGDEVKEAATEKETEDGGNKEATKVEPVVEEAAVDDCAAVPATKEAAAPTDATKADGTERSTGDFINVRRAVTAEYANHSLLRLAKAPVTALCGIKGDSPVTSNGQVWESVSALASWLPLLAARAVNVVVASEAGANLALVSNHLVRLARMETGGRGFYGGGRERGAASPELAPISL